jgi:hypothetical protein
MLQSADASSSRLHVPSFCTSRQSGGADEGVPRSLGVRTGSYQGKWYVGERKSSGGDIKEGGG